MKIIYFVIVLLLSIVLTSCEEFGIEVKTIKGSWESNDVSIYPYTRKLIVTNDAISDCFYQNDSLIGGYGYTWTLRSDTLSLFNEFYSDREVDKYVIEQLSMNYMTLRDISNDRIFVYNRMYYTSSNNYDDKFEEVFNLKKGFEWYIWEICKIIFFAFCSVCSCGIIFGIFSYIKDVIKEFFNKK